MNPARALLVLGTGFMPDGSLRPQARVRVEKAVELFSSGTYRCIIFSGRFPDRYMDPIKCPEYREIMKDPPTEAELMHAYALKLTENNKILQSKIQSGSILDPTAKTTPENLVNAVRIAKKRKINYITAVTNDFHVRRVQLLSTQRGFPPNHLTVVGANTRTISVDGNRDAILQGERNKAREVIANLRKARELSEPLLAQQMGWPISRKRRNVPGIGVQTTSARRRARNTNKTARPR